MHKYFMITLYIVLFSFDLLSFLCLNDCKRNDSKKPEIVDILIRENVPSRTRLSAAMQPHRSYDCSREKIALLKCRTTRPIALLKCRTTRPIALLKCRTTLPLYPQLKRKYQMDATSSRHGIPGGIQNIPDLCRHLYSSCGSAKHR
jgi:hypothetical protein